MYRLRLAEQRDGTSCRLASPLARERKCDFREDDFMEEYSKQGLE
jgi:hypothetical protein